MAVIGQLPQSLPGLRKKVSHISGAITLEVPHNGHVFMVTDPGDSGYTITLPSASDAGRGWHCKFINGEFGTSTLGSGDVLVNPAGADDNLDGCFINGGTNAADTVTGAGDFDTIGFDATSVHGDFIELYTDGQRWFFFGQTAVDGGLLAAG